MELTDYLADVLTDGHDFFNRYTPDFLADAWEAHGEEITRRHIEAHPFTRPSGWWRFEAKQMRRCIEGTPVPMADKPEGMRTYCYGVPRFLGKADFDCSYESVPMYLDHLDLFTDYERRLIEGGLKPRGDEEFPHLKIDTRGVV